MRRKYILILLLVLAPFVSQSAFATILETELWFEPADQNYGYGDSLLVDLYANIIETDAILGFGFDLSFDDGASYISGIGVSGSYLTFNGFSTNTSLFDDPFDGDVYDNGDGIAGAVDFFTPSVWGTDILLGTFEFLAPASGPLGLETIFLGPIAGDYGFFGGEGLVREWDTAWMPNNPTANMAPVPEPATMILFGTGLAGLFGYRRKMKK